ncbi:MAG: DUF3822 family protein [Flavobacteriaceae bacterium]|jgi:hypothetical protein|nr:DUF3822 family protein [Flavobacteriaceae bacterium]
METGQKTIQKKTRIEKTSNIKLSIHISLNGLSFCIIDLISNEIDFLRTYSLSKNTTPKELLKTLKKGFKENNELSNSFSSVKIIHYNNLSTVVPEPLFDKNNALSYLKFNSKILQNDYAAYDEIFNNECVNVYIPYVNINNYIFKMFDSFVYNHYSSIILEKVKLNEKNTITPSLYLNINSNHMELIYFVKNKLIFYNRFDFSTKEDIIYYLLFTIDQLKLNPEEIPLVITGNISEDDDNYKIIYEYIRNVSTFNSEINQENKFYNSLKSDIILLNSF